MIQLTASIDDGSYYDVDVAKLFMKHGIPVTMYLTVAHEYLANVKGYPPLEAQQVNWLAKHCEIGSHTVTHKLLTRIPENDAYNEIVDSKNMLEAQFNRSVEKFCPPRGYMNATLMKMVKDAGYKECRSTLVGNLYPPEDPLWSHVTLHAGINRNEYGNKDWFDYGLAESKKF
jgi:peptidoglycan/xylan/chitin deacetylase (PgdA/CDA1 family)